MMATQKVDKRRNVTLTGSPNKEIRPGLALRNANIGERIMFGGFKTSAGKNKGAKDSQKKI